MAKRIDTRMLRMIIALADTTSAAAAARQLNVTPSALSHQLRKTEEMLGVALFDRSGKRSALTPLGEQLLASARVIIAELDRAEEKLERSRRGAQNTVRIAGGPYSVHRWFAPQSHGTADLWSHLDFVTSIRGDTLAHSVETGELDILLTCANISHRGLSVLPLFEDELVAAVSPNHPLAANTHIEARHLRDITYITYSQVVEPGLDDDLFFRPARFAHTKAREVGTFSAIRDLVAAGAGFTIVSRWEVEADVAAGKLAAIRLTDAGLRVKWSAVVRSADVDRVDLAEVIEFIRNVA